jgi:hypothetical protein
VVTPTSRVRQFGTHFLEVDYIWGFFSLSSFFFSHFVAARWYKRRRGVEVLHPEADILCEVVLMFPFFKQSFPTCDASQQLDPDPSATVFTFMSTERTLWWRPPHLTGFPKISA